MNTPNDAQIIITGADPRNLPEFSAIREEINKASHPSQPEVNWRLVESLALTIFKASGLDLHTAIYYTLACTRLQGLAGFCEGTELLAAMIIHEWNKFWPQSSTARTEMLDWFNTRTGNILRQQTSFTEHDLPLLYRTERALQLICDKLQQVELQRQPHVNNMLYFIQNTRYRLESHSKNTSETSGPSPVRTLVYTPGNFEPFTTGETLQLPPGLSEMRVKVLAVPDNTSPKKHGGLVKGFIGGAIFTAAITAALWWWQVCPLQQQLAQVRDTAQGAASIWLASPEPGSYEHSLQQLLNTSPLQSLNTGIQMTHAADARWPGNLLQKQVSARWDKALKTRANDSPQLRGLLQTRQNLHAFADLIMQREKEGMTLSYIKNVIWQAERGLSQETPIESLLTQYQDARVQGQNTSVLEKQINAQLDGVLSRWLLLKMNVMPEMATKTNSAK